jgi:hypothetical protein
MTPGVNERLLTKKNDSACVLWITFRLRVHRKKFCRGNLRRGQRQTVNTEGTERPEEVLQEETETSPGRDRAHDQRGSWAVKSYVRKSWLKTVTWPGDRGADPFGCGEIEYGRTSCLIGATSDGGRQRARGDTPGAGIRLEPRRGGVAARCCAWGHHSDAKSRGDRGKNRTSQRRRGWRWNWRWRWITRVYV